MRYLSDEWLQKADLALSDMPAIEDELIVGFKVTGGPDGDRAYSVKLGPAPVAVHAGLDQASVTFEVSWDLATSIAQNQKSAQRAFLNGDLVLGGDVSAILGHQQALGDVDDHLSPLRAETDFGN